MNVVRDKWGDLGVRISSAVVMIVAGIAVLLASPKAFHMFVVVLASLGMYEIFSMARKKIQRDGLFSAADLFVLSLYGFTVALGAFGLIVVRMMYGVSGVILVIGLVAVTDTAGYFVGRALGGRKFWPSISPKKTWSGVIGGWIGAVIVGAVAHMMGVVETAVPIMIVLSIALSFTSQLGDIFESSIKRRMGAKDSSNLIPGHGGVLDRFDGLLAAGVVILIVVVANGLS